jgi:hypothetical protein
MRAEQREMAQISYELDRSFVRRESKAELIQQQLMLKFGELPQQVRDRIADGSEAQLMRWSERLRSAGSLNDLFAS